jgi:hypothetical protein
LSQGGTSVARLFRDNAIEADVSQIEHLDESVDHPNRILLVDIVLNRVWKKRRLPPIRTLMNRPTLPRATSSSG